MNISPLKSIVTAVSIFALGISTAFAANGTVTDDFTLVVPGSEISLKVFSGGTSFDSFSLLNNSITFIIPVGGAFVVGSEQGYALTNSRGVAATCVGNASRLGIRPLSDAETSLTVTPSTRVVCPPAEVSSPSITGGSGGTGGGVGGGGSLATSFPGSGGGQSSAPIEATVFKQIFTDTKSLSKKEFAPVQRVLSRMIEEKNFKAPATKKLNPKSKVNGNFALQIALTVSDDSCGKSCLKAAVKEKIVEPNFKIGGLVTRLELYRLMLAAKGIPLTKATADDVKKVCSDVTTISNEDASVFMTVRSLAPVYMLGTQCKLKQTLTRSEALKIADGFIK